MHAACVLRGKIYVVGELDANEDPVKSIECYDPLDNKWSVAGDADGELFLHSLIAIRKHCKRTLCC